MKMKKNILIFFAFYFLFQFTELTFGQEIRRWKYDKYKSNDNNQKIDRWFYVGKSNISDIYIDTAFIGGTGIYKSNGALSVLSMECTIKSICFMDCNILSDGTESSKTLDHTIEYWYFDNENHGGYCSQGTYFYTDDTYENIIVNHISDSHTYDRDKISSPLMEAVFDKVKNLLYKRLNINQHLSDKKAAPGSDTGKPKPKSEPIPKPWK